MLQKQARNAMKKKEREYQQSMNVIDNELKVIFLFNVFCTLSRMC